MTKKDYERAALIAQSWHGCLPVCDNSEDVAYTAVVNAFVSMFQEDGKSRFDEDRFRAACIPGANVKARPRKASA